MFGKDIEQTASNVERLMIGFPGDRRIKRTVRETAEPRIEALAAAAAAAAAAATMTFGRLPGGIVGTQGREFANRFLLGGCDFGHHGITPSFDGCVQVASAFGEIAPSAARRGVCRAVRRSFGNRVAAEHRRAGANSRKTKAANSRLAQTPISPTIFEIVTDSVLEMVSTSRRQIGNKRGRADGDSEITAHRRTGQHCPSGPPTLK
jgi:hypothetical protein